MNSPTYQVCLTTGLGHDYTDPRLRTGDYDRIAGSYGDSDQPDIAYRYADHADHLHKLLNKLDLKNAIFVIHDW